MGWRLRVLLSNDNKTPDLAAGVATKNRSVPLWDAANSGVAINSRHNAVTAIASMEALRLG